MTDEVILPVLAIEHPNMTGAANDFNLTFDVTGGASTGMWRMVIGGRSVVPSATPGRVQDTFTVFYGDQLNPATAAQKIAGAMQTVEQAFAYAADPAAPPAYLIERYLSEGRTRRAQIFSGSIAYVDDIPGWELSKGARKATITLEREAVWQGRLLVTTMGNLSDPARDDALASMRLLNRGANLGGNRPGRVEQMKVSASGAGVTLRQVWVGFKDASRAPLNVGFDPHINVARGTAGLSTSVAGASLSTIVADAGYWRGRALRIRFRSGAIDERSFRVRQQVPYAAWNVRATAANYAKMAGRYRLVGRVIYAGPDAGATYQLRAGLAFGAYAPGRQGIQWLDDIYEVRPDGAGDAARLVDFGEVVLPSPQSTMAEWNVTAGAMNPLIVIGAGLVSGDAENGMIRMDRLVLVPADYYMRLEWPGGVSGEYHYRIFGGSDGSAVAYTSNQTATGLAAGGKDGGVDSWRDPWNEIETPEDYELAQAAAPSGGYWSEVTDVTVGENGFYAPFSAGSAVVVVADGRCSVDLYNRERVAT